MHGAGVGAVLVNLAVLAGFAALYLSLGAVPMNEWTVFRLTDDALMRAGRP